jgi:hypothetical protein
MYNVWNATASLARPGASCVALVNTNPVASAYGLTATLGPVQSAGNDQVAFRVAGNTPGAPVSVLIQGYQASDVADLPQLGGTGNATIVNVQPQDGAEIVNIPATTTQPGNYSSGLLDVSQWESVALAINPIGTQVIGVTLQWFAPDGQTQVGGWAAQLELPATGGFAGAQFPFAQLLLPNRGPLVQLAANAITGGPSFQWGANLFQSNRLSPGQPYSVQGPWLAYFQGFTLGAGNTQNIPLTALYAGPMAVHVQIPAGPTQLNLQAIGDTGTMRTVFTASALAATSQFQMLCPGNQAQLQVANNTASSQTYSLQAYATPTGSS